MSCEKLVDAISKVKEFCATLSEDELKIAKMYNYDYDGYKTSIFSDGKYRLYGFEEDKAVALTLQIIEDIKKELATHKENVRRKEKGLTVLGILKRLINLQPLIQTYVKRRLALALELDRDIAMEHIVEDLADMQSFVESPDADSDDIIEAEKQLELIDNILKEVE
jgi:hypothetical protein